MWRSVRGATWSAQQLDGGGSMATDESSGWRSGAVRLPIHQHDTALTPNLPQLENAIELSSGDESSSDDQPIVLAPTKKRASSGNTKPADRPVPRPAVHGSASASKKRSAADVPLSSESEDLPDLHFGSGFSRAAPVAKLPQRSRSDGPPKNVASGSVKREASGSGARDSAVPAPRRAPVVHMAESDEDVKVHIPATPAQAEGAYTRFATLRAGELSNAVARGHHHADFLLSRACRRCGAGARRPR
jgi:hypothetical protein